MRDGLCAGQLSRVPQHSQSVCPAYSPVQSSPVSSVNITVQRQSERVRTPHCITASSSPSEHQVNIRLSTPLVQTFLSELQDLTMNSISVMTIIHHRCDVGLCFLLLNNQSNCTLNKDRPASCDAAICHEMSLSAGHRKLFNVYDKVSPVMIMRDSRSHLMILIIFDPAACRPRATLPPWFRCTLAVWSCGAARLRTVPRNTKSQSGPAALPEGKPGNK